MEKPAVSQPTKFVCAVCDQTRPLQVEGRQAYKDAGNGNRICFSCVNAADEKGLAEGKGVSLNIDLVDGKWVASNATGKLTFALQPRQPGLRLIQWLAAPTFTHKGRLWAGRTYFASGTAHFVPQKVKAPTAGGRDGKAAKPTTPAPTKRGAYGRKQKGKAAAAAV